MSKNKIVRLEPFGLNQSGKTEIKLNAEDFQSELPIQHEHVYFEDKILGLKVGVWDTTSMQEVFGPYPGDEFMWLLKGQVSILDGDDNPTLIEQGQTFCVRNGIPVSWKQVGYLHKIYMTYSNPGTPTPEIVSADGGVITLDAESLNMTIMADTDPFVIEKNKPLQRDNSFFTNDEKNMFAGLWDSTAFTSTMRPYSFHELVMLLDGEVTIIEGDRTEHRFQAGDAFFIPMGTICQWKTDNYIKKFYAIVNPSVEK
jgi:uncharacterized cupin superfamily protein